VFKGAREVEAIEVPGANLTFYPRVGNERPVSLFAGDLAASECWNTFHINHHALVLSKNVNVAALRSRPSQSMRRTRSVSTDERLSNSILRARNHASPGALAEGARRRLYAGAAITAPSSGVL
jgi:hypothetical protein